MSNQTQSQSSGISFFGLLTILFIGLKLTGVIDWTWWWVLSPLWISGIIGFVVLVLMFLIVALIKWADR